MTRRSLFALLAVVAIVFLVALPAAALAAPAADSSIVHVVRPGETLYSIARFYGVDMWALARANNIVNPNHIFVGQRLVISSGTTPGTGTVHIVQRGDTLFSIGRRYGVSMWDIAQANGISNVNHIWVGQRLVIPKGSYTPPPTPPPSTGNWFGQYYNNLNLAEPPCATRYDEGINFNWGWSAPASQVSSDQFSARWTRTVYLSGGTYRFYARVDDGVRVWVDGALIIDQWHDGALRTFSADRTLSAGNHDIRVEYYDRIQVARIHFWWEKLTVPEPKPTPTATTEPTAEPSGAWFGQFYNNEDLADPPVATRYDPYIGFEWETDSPIPGVVDNDHFSVRWTTTAHLGVGKYNFCAMTDDGVRIFVDGVRVLDQWHANNGIAYCGEHRVQEGNYEIVVEYFEGGGDALIYVWWE